MMPLGCVPPTRTVLPETTPAPRAPCFRSARRVHTCACLRAHAPWYSAKGEFFCEQSTRPLFFLHVAMVSCTAYGHVHLPRIVCRLTLSFDVHLTSIVEIEYNGLLVVALGGTSTLYVQPLA